MGMARRPTPRTTVPPWALHSSGALEQVQGDGTRNVTGTIGPSIDAGSSGIVYRNGQSGYMLPSAAHYATAFHHIDISRVVPTANENRPANTAVRFLIRARPQRRRPRTRGFPRPRPSALRNKMVSLLWVSDVFPRVSCHSSFCGVHAVMPCTPVQCLF